MNYHYVYKANVTYKGWQLLSVFLSRTDLQQKSYRLNCLVDISDRTVCVCVCDFFLSISVFNSKVIFLFFAFFLFSKCHAVRTVIIAKATASNIQKV